ncbi:MAG: hypothetical protein EXQ86_04545 [Rhodospirillales bacterium]|nr:hypothetical protein [Rhodospirillales bacterium]
MTFHTRIGAVVGYFVVAAAAVFAMFPPVPQPPAYHEFADARGWLGVPNAANVLSNVAFAAAGALGLLAVRRSLRGGGFDTPEEAAPYALFFLAAIGIGLGSAYYHWAPGNGTLIWDRLPMTVAFMSFLAAIVTDRIDRQAAAHVLAGFVLIGVASVGYWAWTEHNGRGDLRPYGIVQFLPMLGMPVICWLFPRARYTKVPYIIWVFVLYGVAKLLEVGDHAVFAALGGVVSGHTLKHVFAAAAIGMVMFMLPALRREDGGRGSPALDRL